jgi:hypothetical protein
MLALLWIVLLIYLRMLGSKCNSRVITRAVSCWLLALTDRPSAMSDHVGFLVDKVTLGLQTISLTRRLRAGLHYQHISQNLLGLFIYVAFI